MNMTGSISVSEALSLVAAVQNNNDIIKNPDTDDALLVPDRFHVEVDVTIAPALASTTGFIKWALVRFSGTTYTPLVGTTLVISGRKKEDVIILKGGRLYLVQNVLNNQLRWEIDIKTKRRLERNEGIAIIFLSTVATDAWYAIDVFWE